MESIDLKKKSNSPLNTHLKYFQGILCRAFDLRGIWPMSALKGQLVEPTSEEKRWCLCCSDLRSDVVWLWDLSLLPGITKGCSQNSCNITDSASRETDGTILDLICCILYIWLFSSGFVHTVQVLFTKQAGTMSLVFRYRLSKISFVSLIYCTIYLFWRETLKCNKYYC